jgi:hypothetical protein
MSKEEKKPLTPEAIQTLARTCVDLALALTAIVSKEGEGLVHVTLGWMEFTQGLKRYMDSAGHGDVFYEAYMEYAEERTNRTKEELEAEAEEATPAFQEFYDKAQLVRVLGALDTLVEPKDPEPPDKKDLN